MDENKKSYTKPYQTHQLNWESILQKQFSIPMIQREYSWEKKEISQLANDLINICEEHEFIERMGSLIIYTNNSRNEIYDGQQRILTTVVLLAVLSRFSNKLKRKFEYGLTLDEIDELTDEQKEVKEKYNATIVPKIHCVNPDDREALVNIYNNKNITPLSCFIANKEQIMYDEHETYTCICGTDCARRSDFERHCARKHKYVKPASESKLYAAYDMLYFFIEKQNYTEEKLANFWRYIVNNIDIHYVEVYNQKYASRIFILENNRGRLMPCLDLLKNAIIQKIPDKLKKSIYDKWEELKKAKNEIYNNYLVRLC